MHVINNEVLQLEFYSSIPVDGISMSDISACHWTRLTSPLSAGQDLPLLSGAFRQPPGDPHHLQSIVECDHPTENVLMPACEVVLTCSHISNMQNNY